MNYWLLNTTLENFRVTRGLGFTIQGFPGLDRRKVERMRPGDRLLYYLGDVKQFAATATITSTFFQENQPHWKTSRPEEVFPHRIRVRPQVVLEEHEFIEGVQIGPRLEYMKKWLPERWPLALVGDLHLLPRKDFELLEQEMHRTRAGKQPRLAAPGLPSP